MPGEQYRLYAGHGRKWPTPLIESDFKDDFMSSPVARRQAERLQEDYDWWVVFDVETGKFDSTWSTGRTNQKAQS